MSRGQTLVLGAYGALLLVCVALLLGAEFVGPSMRQTISPLAVEGFKTVLGAIVGSLSMLMGLKK
jgi:hypothetical protein